MVAARKVKFKGKPNYFRYIEGLLYDYKTFPSVIANLEDELKGISMKEGASVVTIGPGSSRASFGSPVESFYITREEGKIKRLLMEKERQYKAIKDAREKLTLDEAQFVYLKYDLEKSHKATYTALQQAGICMSERSYYRWRRRIIEKIAKFILG